MKSLPWNFLDTLNPPLDMVHRKKPDFYILLPIFSIVYYKVDYGINDDRKKFQYQSQVGITVGNYPDEKLDRFLQ